MDSILADFSVSISELKKNPTALLKEAEGNPITILNHNKPTAYLIPAETYEQLLEIIENQELSKIIYERKNERNDAIEVSLDDL